MIYNPVYDQASKEDMGCGIQAEDSEWGELDGAGRASLGDVLLSEAYALEGWVEGHVLTGRHGLFSTYEAFVHVIDSMFNQHAKWLEKSNKLLRMACALPLGQYPDYVLVWRQDYSGNDPPEVYRVSEMWRPTRARNVVRIYLLLDANCLLSVADHCLRSRDYVNVIVADKQDHLQYLTMEAGCTSIAPRGSASGIGPRPMMGMSRMW